MSETGSRRQAFEEVYWVLGSDPDVGKTTIATALIRLLNRQGIGTVGFKPYAAARLQDLIDLMLENYPKFQCKAYGGDALKLATAWAEACVKYWTGGEGRFATLAMEDTGTLQSLTFLDQAGRADIDRVMVLRTTGNFTMQHPGQTAAESMLTEGKAYSAFLPSLDAAYLVGSKVVNELSGNWPKYEAGLP